MIKASAGGGGKGMRVARNPDAVAEGFVRARSEAQSSFGDDRVFIERYVDAPRHVEIQVLGDRHGNLIHLGERECSIQRRNQKIVEEAPSPAVDAALRAAMGAAAVALAKAVGYDSAGTVEFILAPDRRFYFLEMNTRLQVEHPVSELVTGIDLVEQMIRVAAGERLALRQEDVRLDGAAIESRLYAEDPYRGFLPSIGRLSRYRPPPEGKTGEATIRIDSGVAEGSEISLWFDPLIAKLVTHAPDRAAAIDAMAEALDRFEIDGIAHNQPFLAALMDHPRWREGRLSTGFIAEEYPDGFGGASPSNETLSRLAIIALSIDLARRARLAVSATVQSAFPLPGGERDRVRRDRLDAEDAANARFGSGATPSPAPPALGRGRDLSPLGRGSPVSWSAQNLDERKDWVVRLGDHRMPLTTLGDVSDPDIGYEVLAPDADKPVTVVSDWRPGATLWTGVIGDFPLTVQLRPAVAGVRLSWRGVDLVARAMPPRTAALDALMRDKPATDTGTHVRCPMPGLVVAILVEPGQEVRAGAPLAIVEAMKMENILRAERDATIAAILAKPGDVLAVDAVIMELM
jgi:propionyl-CoA carboxylase alpha chain